MINKGYSSKIYKNIENWRTVNIIMNKGDLYRIHVPILNMTKMITFDNYVFTDDVQCHVAQAGKRRCGKSIESNWTCGYDKAQCIKHSRTAKGKQPFWSPLKNITVDRGSIFTSVLSTQIMWRSKIVLGVRYNIIYTCTTIFIILLL